MVADLLEAQERREDGPAPLDALALVERARQVVDGTLVERGLGAGERAERRHLGLVGEIGDDASVGLEATQDVGPHERAKGRVALGLALGHATGRAPELPGAPEQPGGEEVEERPEIAETVLHRRAGEREPHAPAQTLGQPGLPRAGILDGLRLVEHHEPHSRSRSHGTRPERAVGGEHRVGRVDLLGAPSPRARPRPWRRRARRRAASPGEALGLGRPVGEQRAGHDEEGGRRPRASPPEEQEREHLEGLAEAHVVGEADAQAELVRPTRATARPTRWYGRSEARSSPPGSHRRERLRGPQPVEDVLHPGSRLDARPPARRSGEGAPSSPASRPAREHPHRLVEDTPSRRARLLDVLPVLEHLAKRAPSASTHRPLMRTRALRSPGGWPGAPRPTAARRRGRPPRRSRAPRPCRAARAAGRPPSPSPGAGAAPSCSTSPEPARRRRPPRARAPPSGRRGPRAESSEADGRRRRDRPSRGRARSSPRRAGPGSRSASRRSRSRGGTPRARCRAAGAAPRPWRTGASCRWRGTRTERRDRACSPRDESTRARPWPRRRSSIEATRRSDPASWRAPRPAPGPPRSTPHAGRRP